MADRASIKTPAFCPTKKHLTDLFVAAVREAAKLINAEMEAVIADKPPTEQHSLEIARALEQCDRAVYLLHAHEHDCLPGERDEPPFFTSPESEDRSVGP